MSHLIHCDRCGKQERLRLIISYRDLPSGWETVCGADLCENCGRLLHQFLQPIPKLSIAERNEAEKNA